MSLYYEIIQIPLYIRVIKNGISSEFFIWTSDQMVARARVSNHLFIDGTFHHHKNFEQLLIILFKDIINSNYLPCFYVLMSNKTEILYDLVFKSIKRILTQYNQYKLNIITITIDTEIPLINALAYNFDNYTRIGSWFHL